jgi:hypothetical protein
MKISARESQYWISHILLQWLWSRVRATIFSFDIWKHRQLSAVEITYLYHHPGMK